MLSKLLKKNKIYFLRVNAFQSGAFQHFMAGENTVPQEQHNDRMMSINVLFSSRGAILLKRIYFILPLWGLGKVVLFGLL